VRALLVIPKANSNLKRSRIQERKGSRLYDGSLQPGSGNRWHSKGDIETETELIECKTTVRHSYSLKAADLDKAMRQALLEGKRMVFEIEFVDDGLTVVVLDRSDYMLMRETGSSE
jgi:hypothetical protein